MPPDRCGQPCTLVDLPGFHDLSGGSEDEAVVQRFLRNTRPDLILLVINASQIGSPLRLALQLQELGIPMGLALNMSDEARRLGIRIDQKRLSAALRLPVRAINAKRRQGVHELIEALHRCGERAGHAGGRHHVGTDLDALVRDCAKRPERLRNPATRRADRLLLHPVAGLAMFELLYALGAPLQDLLGSGFHRIQAALLEPGPAAIGAPPFVRDLLIEGVWMGMATVATFLPIIFLFCLILAVVEDAGHLPRAAFLMDGFMRWLGLDGRAFVLQVMGFGCNGPSMLGTRVIRDRARPSRVASAPSSSPCGRRSG